MELIIATIATIITRIYYCPFRIVALIPPRLGRSISRFAKSQHISAAQRTIRNRDYSANVAEASRLILKIGTVEIPIMSTADKNKPAGKPGKRNRKTEQRNHEADRQISSMPNEEQDAEEQMGAAAEPGHVGSSGAAARPADVASISPAAEPADEALIDALTEPADIDPMDASEDADEIRSISPAPEPAHAAQISRVAEPAEVT